MKKILIALFVFASALSVVSCQETETYAEQKDAERETISSFVAKAKIKSISEKEFKDRFEKYKTDPSTVLTDTAKNEWVVFNNTGVYMQIVEIGCGDFLQRGKSAMVNCRFTEWNLSSSNPIDNPDSYQLSNQNSTYIYSPDVMSVANNSGTFTASFTSGAMYSNYGASVPAGWLVPLTYIKLGRQSTEAEKIAHVRLIVPSPQGHQSATQYVYACYYDLTYQL